MYRRDVPGLSAMLASADACRRGASGLSAVSLHGFLLAIPALCGLAYPSLLSLLSAGLVAAHGSASPQGAIVGVGVVACVTLALAVMSVSFVYGLALGSSHAGSHEARLARSIAHLAFATPSLYVGFANVAGVLQAPSAVPIAWSVFWTLAAMMIVLERFPAEWKWFAVRQRAHAKEPTAYSDSDESGHAPGPGSSPAAVMTSAAHHRLAIAHGVSATALLLLFVGPHIVNHVAGIWNGPLHIEIMNAVRRIYRDDIVQPVLLALIGFQILSGTALVRRRMAKPSDFLGTVQTMSGIYVGVYFLAHMTAVFAARHAGTDTNWTWLTGPGNSMLVSLSSLRLVAHYWVGPVAIVTHVACGLRMVLLQQDVSPATANRLALVLVIVGAVASSVILGALLDVHIG